MRAVPFCTPGSSSRAATGIGRLRCFRHRFALPGSRHSRWLAEQLTVGWATPPGDNNRLDFGAVDMVGCRVDAMLVVNSSRARAAQPRRNVVATVMANVPNAAGNGFITTLAKPAGNVTGITSQLEEVLAKLVGVRLPELRWQSRRKLAPLGEVCRQDSARCQSRRLAS